MSKDAPARVDGLVAIARRLCALGANPNAEYHWNWHPELPRTALWAAVCAVRHLPLAEVLLEAGANPTDGVTGHIAGGGGNLEALELLHRYGLNVNGIPGGVPPLVYMMRGPTLRQVRAGCSITARTRISPGAMPARRRCTSRPAAGTCRWSSGSSSTARMCRAAAPMARRRTRWPSSMATRRSPRGCSRTAPSTSCRRSNASSPRARAPTVPAADAILAAHPGLRSELRPEHHLMLHRPAESGNAAVLETMLACGFDPNAKDKDNVTPLHRAAMGGHVDAVRVLLNHGADVNALDGMFSASPLVWAVEGRSHAKHPGADHVGVARLLIAAGSPLDWTPPEGAPNPERTLEGLTELRRDAANSVSA